MKKNVDGLKQYNSSIKENNEKAVLKAIDVVRKSNKPFTLKAVCDEAGVSRTYFTKHPELMEIVDKYRNPTGHKKVQTKDSKDALIISLRAENSKLKKQLKAVSINDNYKNKYEEALMKIEELERQLENVLTMNLDTNF